MNTADPTGIWSLRTVIVALLIIAILVVAALALTWLGQRRWAAATATLEQRLLAAAAPARTAVYSETELVDLPERVAQFFRAALRDGQPIIQRARITWNGSFNMGKPGADQWKPLNAEQLFVPGAPGFVWDARISMLPGMPVLVRDAFVAGNASMVAALAGVKRVVDVRGTPTLASGALQRYLGEAAWFPTALLPSQGVVWMPIDRSRARASIRAGETTVALEFRFGADGLIESTFTPDRYYDDGKTPARPLPWTARNLRYTEWHGMKVPAAAVVEWQMPEGAYRYWRGEPVAIEFEFTDRAIARAR